MIAKNNKNITQKNHVYKTLDKKPYTAYFSISIYKSMLRLFYQKTSFSHGKIPRSNQHVANYYSQSNYYWYTLNAKYVLIKKFAFVKFILMKERYYLFSYYIRLIKSNIFYFQRGQVLHQIWYIYQCYIGLKGGQKLK